ncbi:MAG: hypothetical protein ACRD4R_17195 [Candidatus Acidiferrales bacterium]
MIPINAVGVAGQNVATMIDANPTTCPICHHAIIPIDLGVSRMLTSSNSLLERLFQCPNRSCFHLFIGRYSDEGGVLRLNSCASSEQSEVEYSKIVSAISKDFCNIANEAHKAEKSGLLLVAGPGYRKALEFLIKDYLLKLYTGAEEREKIEQMQLGSCIANYVKNDRINQAAARAAWLGNDETHYVRKWEGKDLSDLKRLIQLTVLWIEMEQMTDEAIRDMPQRGK